MCAGSVPRPSLSLLRLLLHGFLLFASLLLLSASQASEISNARLTTEKAADGYRLNGSFDFTLNNTLQSALTRGVPLYFTLEANITRPRKYWFDESVSSMSRTTRISYNVLTGQYHVSTSGLLQRSFPTLEAAMDLVLHPRWIIAEPGTLEPGYTYTVAVRLMLDVSLLPKPFQINAINDNDWKLSSNWILLPLTTE